MQVAGLPAREIDPGMGARLRRDLVSYWPLNEGAGEVRRDLFGPHPLSDTNTVGTTTGPNTYLTAAADYVAASLQYNSIALTTGLTMAGNTRFAASGWVLINTAASTVQTIMGEWAGGGARAFVIRTLSSRFSFSVTTDATNITTVSANNLGAPSTGVWYFLAVYYDGVNIGISANGGAWDTAAFSTGIWPNTTGVPFEIGRANSNGQYLNGALAGWGVWKRAVNTKREIAYLYNGGLGRTFPWKDATPA